MLLKVNLSTSFYSKSKTIVIPVIHEYELFNRSLNLIFIFKLYADPKYQCTAICSFSESKILKLLEEKKHRDVLTHSSRRILRVYPKGTRVDSSNYDPVQFWILGILTLLS